ncbi:MAG: ROK family protein [Magnetococcales bacterium]|nr:ROK family protein [Magnetococcales bacterium]
MKKPVLGLDLGGTKIATAMVDPVSGGLLGEGIRLRRTFASEGEGDVFAAVVAAIEETMAVHGLKVEAIGGIGLCVPSPVDPRTGFLYNPPNLRGWANIPLREKLQEVFPTDVAVDNDANAAALAETRWGAARGLWKSVVYATVSTGIGTGIIINGAILHGKNGLAGEGGHVPLDGFGNVRCGCGNMGCIEALASGTAMVKLARERLRQKDRNSLLLELSQGDMDRIDMVMIGEAAGRLDPFSQEIVEIQGMRLGLWLGGMIALFDPEMVVIGGGCSNLGEPLFRAIRQTMVARTIHPKANEIPVVPAGLGSASGVMGAASLLSLR